MTRRIKILPGPCAARGPEIADRIMSILGILCSSCTDRSLGFQKHTNMRLCVHRINIGEALLLTGPVRAHVHDEPIYITANSCVELSTTKCEEFSD